MHDDDLTDLPGLASFGVRLGAAAAAAGPPRSTGRWRGLSTGLLATLAVAGASTAGTAALLRASVIEPTKVAPREQTPIAGTGHVLALRAGDPGGGPPWALRVSRGATGLTCTTVGQVDGHGAFGIVGSDNLFRALPDSVVDACGTPGSLIGARAVAAGGGVGERSIVYGVAGQGLAKVVATVRGADRTLAIGDDGAFLTAVDGATIDVGLDIETTFTDGTRRNFPIGASDQVVTDAAGSSAFQVSRFGYDTPPGPQDPAERQPRDFIRCGQLYGLQARRTGNGNGPIFKTPTACVADSSGRRWAADARTLRPGESGVPGFDRWTWGRHPARTVVWGIGRDKGSVRSVTLTGAGAGAPVQLQVSPDSVFGAVLAPTVDPAGLRLVVRFADGRVQRGRPGVGLTPDTVASRRYR